MRYYLQYHNCDKLGWVPLDAEPFVQTQLAVYTRRPGARKALGATVFVIASFGRPKRYYLWERFVVEKVEPEGANFCAWGPGWQLIPPQRLHGEDFEAFRKACAYFIGFRAIDNLPYCATLNRLSMEHRGSAVTPGAEAFCTGLLAHTPGCGDAWFFRGVVRARLGRRAEALADLAVALTLDTEFAAEAEALRLALSQMRS
jgi:hypothetical protein